MASGGAGWRKSPGSSAVSEGKARSRGGVWLREGPLNEMPVDGPGKSEMQGLSLPAATQARLAWRPPALRAAQSLFSALPSSFSALGRINRILEWQEPLAHRFRRWLGWARSPLEFGTEMIARNRRENPPHKAAISARLAPQVQQSDALEAPAHAASPLARTEDSPEKWSADVRPVRRSPSAADGDTRISISGPFAGELRREKTEPVLKGPSQTSREEFSPFTLPGLPLLSAVRSPGTPDVPRPRLQLSVSPTPRREVSGVLLQSEPILAGAILDEASGEKAITRVVANETSIPTWEAARQSIAAAALRSPDIAANSSARGQTAIEKLIEQTRRPVPLPGLEIRVVRPSQGDEGDPHRSAEEKDRATPNMAGSPPPAASPAHQLDLDAVADKVYQTLMRRQQFERERKGFY